MINDLPARYAPAVLRAAQCVAATFFARWTPPQAEAAACRTGERLEPRLLLAGNLPDGWGAPVDLSPGQSWSGSYLDSLDNLDGEATVPLVAGPDLDSGRYTGPDLGNTTGPVGGGDLGGLGRDSGEAVTLPKIGREFDGVDRGDSGFIPPDTEGAVGLEHVVEMINGTFRVWDKNGNQLETRSLDSFWINRAGVTPSGSFSFDPRIQYDASEARWYATSVDNAGGANSFLFAVTRTSDPTGDWVGFKIDSDPANTRWADFPMMGFDNDGVYITANMFGLSSGTGTEVNILVLPKVDLLLSTPSVTRRTLLRNVIGTMGFAAQPVVYKDSNEGAAVFPPVFASADDNSINFSALGGTIFAPTVVAQSDVAVSNRPGPPLARQPDGVRNLDSGGNRIRSQVVFQNGHYWGVNGVDLNNAAAIRFFKITSAYGLVQDRVVWTTDEDWIYPSIDVNQDEEVAIGFTNTGPGRFPSAAMVLGIPDGTGQTGFPTFYTLQNGNDDYQSLDNSGRNRWGDYSATHFDPQDDSYFWAFQEYSKGVNANGRTSTWGTHVAEFSLQGVVAGRLPRSLATAEGAIAPHGLTGRSNDVTSGSTLMDFDFDVDSYYVSADTSLRGTGNVIFRGDDLGSTAIDPVLALYDSATGEMLALNDDFGGLDDSQITFNIPSTSDRYIIAIGNKLYTSGTGNTSGDLAIVTTWESTTTGVNIALDASGDGSQGFTLSPAADSDFFTFTVPNNTTGSATVAMTNAAALDGDLWVMDAAGAQLGRSALAGLGATATVNLSGLTGGQQLYITVQSHNFATTGSGTVSVDVDTLVVPPTPPAPDLSAGSDSGVSNTDNVTSDTTPTFLGSLGAGNAGQFVRLFRSGVEVGSTTADASGNWTITPAAQPNGIFNFQVTAAFTSVSTQSPLSSSLAVQIDTVAPTVIAAVFRVLTSQTQRFTFSENLGTAPAAGLVTTNLSSGVIPAGQFSVVFGGINAEYRYTGNLGGSPGVLPNGNYTGRLQAGGVTDIAGNPLAAGAPGVDFFVLGGDANRDRTVNLADFGILRANFGATPRDFSQGDFNYDAIVNLADFGILRANFGLFIPAPGGLPGEGGGDDDDEGSDDVLPS